MLNSFWLLTALLFSGPSFVQQAAAPVVPVIPADAVQMTNPAKSTPETMAHAKKIYGYDCAVCHGDSGNGKGELAAQLKLSLKDWNSPAALKNRTDGELFYIIRNGQGQMPAEGERAKPEDVWNMVEMVRSFSKQ
jgi:mono/diheme cytochrome c family protein